MDPCALQHLQHHVAAGNLWCMNFPDLPSALNASFCIELDNQGLPPPLPPWKQGTVRIIDIVNNG